MIKERAVKNGQSRDTSTIGHKTQNEDKKQTNKNSSPTQKTEKRSNTNPTKRPGVTKERAVKNELSRDTGNIGHKTQNKDKQTKTITQKTKMVSNSDPIKRKNHQEWKIQRYRKHETTDTGRRQKNTQHRKLKWMSNAYITKIRR